MAKTHISEVKSEALKQIEALKQNQSSALQPQSSIQQQFQQPVSASVSQLQSQMVAPGPTNFQRHIISRVMPNRKGYVMRFILDLAGENKYSTKEVEEIVVNEKQLCGRTSFYAYLKELKLRGKLNYADIDERTILLRTDGGESSQQTLNKV